MKKLTFAIVLMSLFFVQISLAQWNPAPSQIDGSYPRTLLDASEVQQIHDLLFIDNHVDTNLFNIYEYISDPDGNNNYNAFTTNVPKRSNRDMIAPQAVVAKNAAFVALIGLDFEGNDLPMANRQTLALKVINYLQVIHKDGNNYFLSAGGQLHQYRAAELIMYMQAYDMLMGAFDLQRIDNPYNDQATLDDEMGKAAKRLQQFARNFYSNAKKEPWFNTFGTQQAGSLQGVNNIALMSAAALGISAVVFNDTQINGSDADPQNWISAALYITNNHLWTDPDRLSERGEIAGFAEGPNYFKYCFTKLLPFFHALDNFYPQNAIHGTFNYKNHTIIDPPNPFRDTDYDSLYTWYVDIMEPSGLAPTIDDAWSRTLFSGLALTEKPQYSIGRQGGVPFIDLIDGLDEAYPEQINYTLHADYICAQNPPRPRSGGKPKVTVFRESGDLVFRSDWNVRGSVYMHLNAENGVANDPIVPAGVLGPQGRNHEHADVTSFTISAGTQRLLIDPAFNHDIQNDVNKDYHHNIVTAEDVSTTTPIHFTKTSEGAIGDVFDKEKLDYGNVIADYDYSEKTSINREVLFVRDKYFFMVDNLTSDGHRDYTWQVHANESRIGAIGFTYNNNDESIITMPGAPNNPANTNWRIHAQVSTPSPNNSYSTYRIFKDGNGVSQTATSNLHSTYHLRVLNEKNSLFLSSLIPYLDNLPSDPVNVPVVLKSVTTDYTSRYVDLGDEIHDFVLAQESSNNQTVNNAFQAGLNFETDGKIALLSLNKTGPCFFQTSFLKDGSQLTYDQKYYIQVQSNDPADVQLVTLQSRTATLYEGYIKNNAFAQVAFYLEDLGNVPVSEMMALVNNVEVPSQPGTAANTLIVDFDAPGGHFMILRGPKPADDCLASSFDPIFQLLYTHETGTNEYLNNDRTVACGLHIVSNPNNDAGSGITICNQAKLTNVSEIFISGTSDGSGISELVIEDGSALILEPNSRLTLAHSSQVVIKSGGSLIVKSGAEILLGGSVPQAEIGQLIIEEDAYLSVESSDAISFLNENSGYVVNVDGKAKKGINPIFCMPDNSIPFCDITIDKLLGNIATLGNTAILDFGIAENHCANEPVMAYIYNGYVRDHEWAVCKDADDDGNCDGGIWDFSGSIQGNGADDLTAYFTFDNDKYLIRLFANNDCPATNEVIKPSTFLPPVSDASFTTDIIQCSGNGSVAATTLGTKGFITHTWTVDDGSGAAPGLRTFGPYFNQPTDRFEFPGYNFKSGQNHTITLDVQDCIDNAYSATSNQIVNLTNESAEIEMKANENPASVIHVLVGNEVDLEAVATGGGSSYLYNWQPALGLTSTNSGITMLQTNGTGPGTFLYTVEVTVNDNGSNQNCKEQARILINVITDCSEAPPQRAKMDGITGKVCGGCDVILTASGEGGQPPYDFLWSDGSTTSSITVNIGQTTNYSVMVTDANGVESFEEKTLSVDKNCHCNDITICNNPTEGFTLTASSSWVNEIKAFEGKLVVPNGVTLDIIDSRINFSSCAVLIVEPGGHLNVINSVLRACDENKNWKGVEVWGDNNLPINEESQGNVYLENALITGADIGILAAKRDLNGGYVAGSGGGITITSSASALYNNCTHVVITAHPSLNDKTSITATKFGSFSTNAACDFDFGKIGIYVEQQDGIEIIGNAFEASSKGIFLDKSGGYTIQYNYFEDVEHAIFIENTNSGLSASIEYNNFDGGYYGLNLQNCYQVSLSLGCNYFSDYAEYAIYCNGSSVSDQGTQQFGAGNEFFGASVQTNHQFHYDGDPMAYYFDPSDTLILQTGSGFTATPIEADSSSECLGEILKYERIGKEQFNSSETEIGRNLTVDPNPLDNLANIRFKLADTDENCEIQIYELAGKVLKRTAVSNTQTQVQIDCSDLKQGMYICTLMIDGEAVRYRKILIAR